MIRKAIIILALMPGLANAAGCEDGNAILQSAAAAANRVKQDNDQIAQAQNAQVNSTKSCLDKYRNMSFGGLFGLPSFSWESIAGAITNAACSVIDNKVAQATAPLNTGMVLPGGVGQIDTRVFQTPGINGGGTVEVQTVNNGSGQGLISKTIENVKGIFR
jgi:type II secretory pathway pseudopilin PulG